jgi:hypothetical protein
MDTNGNTKQTIMETNKTEIAPGLFEEPCVPEYINAEWLTEQPETLYRIDTDDGRYYYRYTDGEPIFYQSVTTFISRSLPTSAHLIKWKADMGNDAADEYAELAASAGTFYHIQCGELLMKAEYDLDTLSWKLDQYIQEHHLPFDFAKRSYGLKKDLLCFAQWMIDFNVEPVAVEIILWDDDYMVAGSIDIVAYIDVEVDGLSEERFKSGPRKGQQKPIKVKERQLAIIDIKSGKKGFYPSHEIQLHAYWKAWNQHFPDMPVKSVWNFSPKDFRGSTPTYSFKNQSDAKSAKKLPYLIGLAQVEEETKSHSLSIYHGIIDIKNGLYANVENIELSELVRKRHTLDIDEPNS